MDFLPLKIVDLAIQRGDIIQLIGFYRSNRAAMKYIDNNLDEVSDILGVPRIQNFDEIMISYFIAVIEKMRLELRWPPDGYADIYLYAYRTGFVEVIDYARSILQKPSVPESKLIYLTHQTYSPLEMAVDYRNYDLLTFAIDDLKIEDIKCDLLKGAFDLGLKNDDMTIPLKVYYRSMKIRGCEFATPSLMALNYYDLTKKLMTDFETKYRINDLTTYAIEMIRINANISYQLILSRLGTEISRATYHYQDAEYGLEKAIKDGDDDEIYFYTMYMADPTYPENEKSKVILPISQKLFNETITRENHEAYEMTVAFVKELDCSLCDEIIEENPWVFLN